MADKIAKNAIKTAPDGPDVTFAREISSLLPIFAKNNVRLIGVGLEPLGVDEFIQGKFFGGELFIDMEKKSYSALGFKRMSLLGLFPAVLAKKARDFAARAKKLNLGGNMKGDGFQNGGALVVEVGGTQTLLTYVQQDAPDHVSNAEVLKALGIEDEPVASAEDFPSSVHSLKEDSHLAEQWSSPSEVRTMILSQKKAAAILQPWWDMLLFYTLALTILTSCYLYATSVPLKREVVLGVNDTLMIDSSLDFNFTEDLDSFLENNSSYEVFGLERFSDSLFDPNPDLTSPIRVIGHPKTFWIHRSQPQGFLLALIGLCLVVGFLNLAYDRLFYNAHVVQVICHLMEVQLDLQYYRRVRNNLVFTNTLHRSQGQIWMVIMFHSWNAIRLSMFIVLSALSIYYHSLIRNGKPEHLLISFLLEILLVSQVILLMFASLWTHVVIGATLWGKLMKSYSEAVNKIDVIRGRSVPSPPFRKRSSERVLDSLNPYVSSPNIRLILDLLAFRHGLGVGLKTLAALEIDVQNNWRPLRLAVRDAPQGLEITWKDPLAVLYIMPVPRSLRLCYGLEISFPHHPTFPNEKIVEIVGFEEKRYYEQIWTATRANAVDLKLKESFTYSEVFAEVTTDFLPAFVDVWTILDGQLVSKSSFVCDIMSDTEEALIRDGSPNPVPKPPRTQTGTEAIAPPHNPSPGLTGFQKAQMKASSLQRSLKMKGSNPFEPDNLHPGTRAKSLTNLLENGTNNAIPVCVKKSKSYGNKLQLSASFKRNKIKRLNSYENMAYEATEDEDDAHNTSQVI
ncbi:hypothetical protein TCAL_09031 [Tigriopus californicus]|uniref:Uncharacterized protein n=2 Tax=Tigriopus californicus TaxID=6832 RepID=A0A553ND92_TIGCA|nr:hypothetical protein TCAL_09031 [Tigriopus californicus]